MSFYKDVMSLNIVILNTKDNEQYLTISINKFNNILIRFKQFNKYKK